MVIPGIFVAYFAALSASSFPLIPMCTGTLHSVICFPWLWSSASMSYLMGNFLCCSQWPALNSTSLYILPISYPLFFVSLSLLSFQLYGWRLLLVVTFFYWCLRILLQNLLSIMCSLLHLCKFSFYYCVFLYDVGSAAFSHCHTLYVFPSWQIIMLFTNHVDGCVWFISSIFSCSPMYLHSNFFRYTPVVFVIFVLTVVQFVYYPYKWGVSF